jgi:hypothetical protein
MPDTNHKPIQIADSGSHGQTLALTTGHKPADSTVSRAAALADELGARFEPRAGRSAAALLAATGAGMLLVVQHDGLTAVGPEGAQYSYHPNLITVRGHNVLIGMRDAFVDAASPQPGDRILDCTVGFGCEAILAALIVGESGTVTGLESVPMLAAMTREGMRSFPLDNPQLRAAMRRIAVVTADYREYLAERADKSEDIVYFDPFFEERLPGSERNVSPLHAFGNSSPLDIDAVSRARTVAVKRVVIKQSRHEALPEALRQHVVRTVFRPKAGAIYYVLSAG